MDKFRSHFPILKGDKTFFNHCMVSVIPEIAVATSHQFLRDCAYESVDYLKKEEAVQLCRSRAATLLNAHPDEIAFTGNTSQGINLVANGIPWRRGDSILTCDIEYPDNFYPWKYLERRGVKTVVIPTQQGRITVDDIAKAIDDSTRLVSLSLVQFLNGFRLDAKGIGELCRERKILFMLDSVQALGALQLDVQKVPVDFVAAGGHKWLLGPLGTGIFYCRRESLDQLEVSSIGHGSMVSSDPLPHQFELKASASRFEGGPAENVPGIVGLGASLDLILQAGIPSIEKKILSLTKKIMETLQLRGYQIHSPHADDAERSGIVAFSSLRFSTQDLLRRLAEQQIIVSSPNGEWIRIAPHFYNNEEDMERFFDALPKEKKYFSPVQLSRGLRKQHGAEEICRSLGDL